MGLSDSDMATTQGGRGKHEQISAGSGNEDGAGERVKLQANWRDNKDWSSREITHTTTVRHH